MKKLCIAAALFAIAIIGNSTSASSQIVIPPGTDVICVFECHGIIFIRYPDGTVIELPGDATGQAKLNTVSSNGTDPNQPLGSTFKPTDITVSGSNGTVGNFSFTFDASRPVTDASVTTNDAERFMAGEEFPATGDVYANMTGTIDAFPGSVFTNVTECHIQHTNLGSFNPHNKEVYTFVNDVEFSNNEPEESRITFTIPAGATVTLQ